LEEIAEPDNEQEIADSLDEVEDERNVIDLIDEKDEFPTTVSGDRNLKCKRSDGD